MRSIRQHVNPLGAQFLARRARPVEVPKHLSSDCRVEVELGCADGDFSFAWAQQNPHCFVVGVDIRQPCIQRNQHKAQTLGLNNLTFAYTNLNIDLDVLFAPQSVDRFHLLFPDPWFKPRHKKRRVIDHQLCQTLITQLRPWGELHVTSDVFEVALEIMAELETFTAPDSHQRFRNLLGPWSFWRENPFGVASRREKITQERGQRIWRMCYRVTT